MRLRRLKWQHDQSNKVQYHTKVKYCPKGDRTYLDSKDGKDLEFEYSLTGTQQHALECHTYIGHSRSSPLKLISLFQQSPIQKIECLNCLFQSKLARLTQFIF
jgi:hypothetical protein